MAKTEKCTACPCGGKQYETCCGRFHAGAVPDTAEELMRSRYTAYVLGLSDYLHASWYASTRPDRSTLAHDTNCKWLDLEIRQHDAQGDDARVEFIARYKTGGRAQRLHEVSRFVREDGRWFYLDGSFPERQ